MDQKKEETRRAFLRKDMLLRVSYPGRPDLFADYLTDLSRGGLFVCTQEPFGVGDRIAFAISFPSLLHPIQLQGVVRWRRGPDPERGLSAGVGVEFVFEQESARGALEDFFHSLPESDAELVPDVAAKPFTVLLVEDNQFAHNMFQNAVKRFEQHVRLLSAQNGQEALRCVREERIDMAIVDYFLPVMSGADFVRNLRTQEDTKSVPVLVISSGGEGVREEAIRAGADLYLDKPILLKQLVNTLGVLLTSGSRITA